MDGGRSGAFEVRGRRRATRPTGAGSGELLDRFDHVIQPMLVRDRQPIRLIVLSLGGIPQHQGCLDADMAHLRLSLFDQI